VTASAVIRLVIIGSGAGGGTGGPGARALVRDGVRDSACSRRGRASRITSSPRELEMADALYQDGGAFLTRRTAP